MKRWHLYSTAAAICANGLCFAMFSVTPSAAQTRQGSTGHAGTNSYEIRIDTGKPILFLYANGRLVRAYRVALGKPDSPTPIGSWQIVDKQMDWGKGFGTRWMGLNVPWGIYGIHGTNVPPSIGQYASHGCIRMRNEDVERLYRIVPKGTLVTITGNPLAHPRALEYGNIGADVLMVQKALRRAGFIRVVCDGRFGPSTEFSLLYYELSKGLPMDGVVGMDDYRALGLLRTPRAGS